MAGCIGSPLQPVASSCRSSSRPALIPRVVWLASGPPLSHYQLGARKICYVRSARNLGSAVVRDERRKQRPVVPVRAEIRSSRRRVEAFRVGGVIKASHGCRSQGSDGRRQQPRRYHRYYARSNRSVIGS